MTKLVPATGVSAGFLRAVGIDVIEETRDGEFVSCGPEWAVRIAAHPSTKTRHKMGTLRQLAGSPESCASLSTLIAMLSDEELEVELGKVIESCGLSIETSVNRIDSDPCEAESSSGPRSESLDVSDFIDAQASDS